MTPKNQIKSQGSRRRLITGSRLGFAAGWGIVVVGLYGVLGMVGWLAIREHGDRLASAAWEGGTIRYERLEVTEWGRNIEITGLRVSRSGEAEGKGEPLFAADRVLIRLNRDDFRRPSLEALEMDAPKVFLGEALAGSGGMRRKATEAKAGVLPDWLRVGRVAIRDGAFAMTVPGLPSVSLGYDVEIEGIDSLRPEGESSVPLRFTLRDVRVDDAATGAGALFGVATGAVRVGSDLASGVVEKLRIDGLEARVTEALWETMLNNEGEAREDWQARWDLAVVDIAGAKVEIDGYHRGHLVIPDVRAEVDVEMRGLRLGGDSGDGVSGEVQTLRMRNVVIDAALEGLSDGDAPRLLEVSEAEARVVPDEFLREGWIESLRFRDLLLRVDATRLARLTEAFSAPADTGPPPEAPGTKPGARRPFPSLKARALTVEGGRFESELAGLRPGLPAVSARFRLDTLAPPEEDSAHYAVELSNVVVAESGRSGSAFGRGRRIRARFTPEGVQERNRLEAIEVEGLDVRIGGEIRRLAEAFGVSGEAAAAVMREPTAEPEDEIVPWRAGRVVVRDSRVTLVDIVPGLPFVPIRLETALEEVPLTHQEREAEKVERIELTRLEVTSPYDAFTPVANLRTIFVEFTFAGLLRREIERVEVVSPEIFVGEPLFWYIDYYRELRRVAAAEAPDSVAESAPAPAPVPEPEPADSASTPPSGVQSAEDGTSAALEDVFNNATVSGWKIRKIQAHSGKIIIAPRGQPLGIFPFPFSFESDLERRIFSLQLTVESGDYVFANLEAELIGLSGEAYFNYPIRDRDNNFVQTFTALGLRFKGLEAQGVTLTVTYDRDGIYGKIWSAAYGGNLNAEFNIYLGDTYTWDAWASASGFDLGPFTDAVAPDSFRMKGVLDGKFLANGEGFRAERALGDATVGDGTMHISSLDEVVEALPESWNALQRAIAQAGIDVFRNYDFDEGKASLDMIGRDGTASLVLVGPDGKRDLGFRFHDERDLGVAAGEKKESPPADEAR